MICTTRELVGLQLLPRLRSGYRAVYRIREAPNAHPPAHLLPRMAEVLGVDVLLGQRQATQLLDTFIEREKPKQRVNAQRD